MHIEPKLEDEQLRESIKSLVKIRGDDKGPMGE
jgi:hypothetical protein